MELTSYIACICEGTTEEVIMEKLLDADRLIFTRENLLENELIRTRAADSFEKRYLRKSFRDKITVLRILDSRREKFKTSKAYKDKISAVYSVITAPEIEILIILNEHSYDAYRRSRKKPSDFCKQDLGMGSVKNRQFVERYFSNIDDLISAIREYRRVSDIPSGEYTLTDLLR